MTTYLKRIALPVAVGLAGMLLLIGLYLAVAVLGRSREAALTVLWDNKRAVLPLALGFDIQVSLYTLLWLGLTAAGTLLAQWRMPFMIASALSSLMGISLMGYAALSARRRPAISHAAAIC